MAFCVFFLFYFFNLYYLMNLLTYCIETWQFTYRGVKAKKCLFTYIHLVPFRSHPSIFTVAVCGLRKCFTLFIKKSRCALLSNCDNQTVYPCHKMHFRVSNNSSYVFLRLPTVSAICQPWFRVMPNLKS